MSKFDAVLAAISIIGAMLLASPDAKAAPKWCDTQMYVHACAVGHGGASWSTDGESGSDGGSVS